MRHIFPLLLSAFLFCAGAVHGAPSTIQVRDAWIRTPPNGAQTAAAYATIVNRGIASDRLLGASTPAAADVAVHQSMMSGGMAHMRQMSGGLALAGSASVRLQPGGYHLMLTGLKHPLKPGERVRMVLRFQRAGSLPATFAVRDAAP
jgi:periplasmic copper chaperone A